MARNRRSLVHAISFHPPEWFRRFAMWILAMFGLAALFLVVVVGWRIARAWNTTRWFTYEPFRILYIFNSNQNEEVKSLKLVSVWPDTQRVVEVDIPTDVSIDSVGGYGSYRIGALAPLGKVEKVGDKLLVDSIKFAFGVPVHHVIVSTSNNFNSDWGLVKRQILQEGLTGGRAFNESMAIRNLLSQVKGHTTEAISLSERNVVRTRKDIDGTEVHYFETALLERFCLDSISAVWNAAASMQVAVVNTTGKAQMAGVWSRFARVGGYDVVNVTDRNEMKEESVLVFNDQAIMNSAEGKALRYLYAHAKPVVADTTEYRADVALLIGMDGWKWLNDRQAYLE